MQYLALGWVALRILALQTKYSSSILDSNKLFLSKCY